VFDSFIRHHGQQGYVAIKKIASGLFYLSMKGPTQEDFQGSRQSHPALPPSLTEVLLPLSSEAQCTIEFKGASNVSDQPLGDGCRSGHHQQGS